MQTWYEVKVKYLKIDQNGFERKVTNNYLIDAVSFTDAETRIFAQMNEITNGEFNVMNIKKSNVTDILPSDTGEWWYKAKISLISIDEEAGKEKRINNYVLVAADDIDNAVKCLEDGLSYMLVPYDVKSITQSQIADVFYYSLDQSEK